MSSTMIRSGMGCERDSERDKGGRRLNTRTYLMGNKEKKEFLLGLSDSLRQRDFQQGDLMSELDGKIVPLTLDFPFAGICEAVGQDIRGRYFASVVTRGIVVLRVDGVSQPVRQGTLVYASPTSDRLCKFTLDGTGVLIGEVTNCEVTLTGNVKVHVGLRVPGDSRPYTSESLSDPFKV